MASRALMPGPQCLIENINGCLRINEEALEFLSTIPQHLVVIAIAGPCRSGKSYLLNMVAGETKGFSLGSTVQAHTHGIWMWCMAHPLKRDHILVLLDTEGLDDAAKGHNQNDSAVLALAILLCSTFIYNSMGTINQQALDKLQYPLVVKGRPKARGDNLFSYVTEQTDRIRARSYPDANETGNSDEFGSFFPDFVWTLRDFYLDLKVNGQSITEDQYLENSLKLNQGISQNDDKSNLLGLNIKKFFPNMNCFVFDRPAQRKKLSHLQTLQKHELESEFVQQVGDFRSFIFTHSKVKTLSAGVKVNGPRLKNLVLTYINDINNGDLPCMKNAVLALAQIENTAAVQKAIAHYSQQMDQKVQLPTENPQELLNLHRASEKEAVEVFMKNSFKDVDHLFQKELMAQLEQKLNDFYKQNLQASSDHCCALLQDLFRPLEEEVKQGIYSKPGGYHLFIQKTQELKKKYLQIPRKGVQAEETLQEYLASIESVMDAIQQTDQTLTKKENEIEVERVKAESALTAVNMLESMQIKYHKMMADTERSHQEHVKQLIEKIQEESAQRVEDQKRTLAVQLQEHTQKLKKEFQEESKQLHNEIRSLQCNMNKISSLFLLSLFVQGVPKFRQRLLLNYAFK
ncbi:guanylate-binding protein 1-like [Rhynchocyon petersi]